MTMKLSNCLLRMVLHVSEHKSQSPYNDVSLIAGILAILGTHRTCSYLRAFALATLTVLAA